MAHFSRKSKNTRSASPYIQTEYNDGALGYIHCPSYVSPDVRELAFSLYPALENREYRGIFEFCLASPFYHRDVYGEYTDDLVCPHQLVYEVTGQRSERGFSAIRCLETFERDVLSLNIEQHIWKQGLATQIAPDIDPDFVQHWQQDRLRADRTSDVCFVTGRKVSRQSRREQGKETKARLQAAAEKAALIANIHPGIDVLTYLNSQPNDTFELYYARNIARVWDSIRALPPDDRSRDYSIRVLSKLEHTRRTIYRGVANSPRFFSGYPSHNHLPREARKLLLSGATELDLRACQLGIAAMLWKVGPLQRFLELGKNIWEEFEEYLRMPLEIYKPILKTTVYSIMFCMSEARLLRQLAYGTRFYRGVGEDAARKFFRHYLIEALLEARTAQSKAIKKAKFAVDAFGNVLPTQWNKAAHRYNIPTVMSAQVTSYELQLMMSMFPIIEAKEEIRVMSWLHDGMTLHFSNRTKKERQIEQLKEAVNRQAQTLGVETGLERKEL